MRQPYDRDVEAAEVRGVFGRTSAWIFDRKRDGDQDRTDYTDRKTERFFGRGDQGKDKGDVCIR